METPQAAWISVDIRVMFYDTDAGGVVSNISYLRFIEYARTLLAEQLGWRMDRCEKEQCYPVVARTEIDYRRPALLGDALVVEGWLEEVRRGRFWCGFRIQRRGEVLTTCRQMLALVRMPSGRPVRVPEEWARRASGRGGPEALRGPGLSEG